MTSLRSGATTAGFRVAVRIVGSIAQAVTLLLLARLAGPTAFGTLAVVVAVGYFVGALTSFGTSARVLRIGAEKDDKGTRSAAYAWIRLGSCVATAACCLSLTFLFDNLAVVALATAWITLDSVAEFSQSYLAGFGRHTASSMMVIAQRIFPLAGCWAAEVIATSWKVSFAAGIAASLVVCAMPFFRVTLVPLGIGVKGAAGYWLASVGSNISQLELPLVRSLTASPEFGLFALAARTASPLTIVGAALQSVFVPELARALGTERFKKVFRVILAVSVTYAVALAALAPIAGMVIDGLLGNEYEDAGFLISVFVASAGLASVAQSLQARLFALGTPARSAFAVVGGVLLGLAYDAVILGFVSPELLWTCPIFMNGAVLILMVLVSVRPIKPRSGIRA